MTLQQLRDLLAEVPSQYSNFEVISLQDMKVSGNGYVSVTVPINHVALDLKSSGVILVDDHQANIFKAVGKVPSKPV